MFSKENIKQNKNHWSSNIFIIPNDLFYDEHKSDKNDINKNKKQDNLSFNTSNPKFFFTDFLKPNWKKHINSYKKRNLLDYRKKLHKYTIIYE